MKQINVIINLGGFIYHSAVVITALLRVLFLVISFTLGSIVPVILVVFIDVVVTVVVVIIVVVAVPVVIITVPASGFGVVDILKAVTPRVSVVSG